MKNGPSQFKLWYLLAVVLIVGLAVGVSYFKNASTDENSQPPSLKIGSVLLKGQAVKNGLVKYDAADKDKSNKANYGAKVSANVNKGVGFYYTDEDITLDKLLDSSQCLNANVGRTLFFSYSPGGEPGAEKAGFYVYPEVLASGGNTGIADSSKYLIKKGRVFGLYSDNPVTGHCFKDAETKANVVPDFGALKNGWVQIAAKDNKLSTILEPVKDCVNSVWVQDGIDSFDTKIPAANYVTHNLGNYKLLWINLKDCEPLGSVVTEKLKMTLSASSPEATTLAQGDTKVVFAFDLLADKDMGLKSISLTRKGVGKMSDFSAFEMLLGSNVIANGKMNGDKIAFDFGSGGFSLDAGSVESLLIRAHVADNAVIGNVSKFVVESSSDIVLDSELALAGLPLEGNFFTIGPKQAAVVEDEPAPVVDAVVQNVAVTKSSLTKNTFNAGDAASAVLAILIDGENEPKLTKLVVTYTGDIQYLENFKLEDFGGMVIGKGVLEGSKIVFNLSEPAIAKPGFVIKVDVKKSAPTSVYKFSIWSSSDIVFDSSTNGLGSFPIMQEVNIKADTKPGVVQNFEVKTQSFLGGGDALVHKAKLLWDSVIYPAGLIKSYEVWYGKDFDNKSNHESATFANDGVEMDLADGQYWFKVRAIGEVGVNEYVGDFSNDVEATVK